MIILLKQDRDLVVMRVQGKVGKKDYEALVPALERQIEQHGPLRAMVFVDSVEGVGETTRRLAEIRSEARRQAEVIKGNADAEATRIYNQAYAEDTGFYSFWRTMQSYRKSLAGAVLVLGPESDFLGYLRRLWEDGEQEPAGH